MDSTPLIQVDNSSPETFSDSSLSPDSPDSNDIFGEPLVHPRVGDEYQAEIPSLLKKSNLDSPLSFLMGLPLPVMWIGKRENSIKESMEGLNDPNGTDTNGQVKVDAPSQTCSLVPGQPSDPWSNFEEDCFLLGLYIFGKNLLQVMSFMESKEIGQILAYYYGRFYGSSGYRKWVECRKMRNRKCVLGHRFFTGYRQHELFARLSPRLSEESKAKFLEVSRAFVEGSTLEEYVSSLKSLVGIHALVQAVGIGKGKDDLTTLIFDGTKNNHIFTQRPEIPSGKACSSLSSSEIVKYLTGDFRLSKARSNDLFWEAVWPRLLARGWHSEQPHGDNYPAGSKNCLVFLIPGIKKFSRRKLSKGDHYFDSVTDVLAKVASQPELLELDRDELAPSSSKVENGWAMDVKSDDHHDHDHDLDHDRHCYLKPRVSSEISDLFKFTVVDTSLANEDNPYKIRELRSLPLSAKRCSAPKKFDGNNTMKSESERILPKDNISRTIKHQFTRRNKPGLTGCSSGQVTKRRRVVSSVDRDMTYVLGLPARIYKIKIKNKNVVPSRNSTGDNSNEKILQDQSLTESGFDFSQGKENSGQEQKAIDLNLPQVEPERDGKVKPEVKIESDCELNLEGGKISVFEQPEGKKPEHSDISVSCATLGPTEKSGEKLDQQPRRQSTRNRPLTTKALEALEIGLLNPIRESRKRSSSTLQEKKSKRSSQQREKNSTLPPVVDLEERVANESHGEKISEIAIETSFAQKASSKEMFT